MKNFTFILICLLAIPGLLMAQWKSVDIGTGENSNKLYAFDNQHAIIIGNDTAIVKTNDAGISWEKKNFVLPNNVEYHFMDIDFTDDVTGFIAATKVDPYNGIMLKSTDAGENWSEFPLVNFSDGTGNDLTDPTAGIKVNFTCVSFEGDNGYVAVQWKDASDIVTHGYIFKTTDKGVNWSIASSDLGNKSVFSIEFIGETVYVGGNNSLLIKSVNGGTSWVDLPLGTITFVSDLRLIDADKFYIASMQGTFYSENGGTTINQLKTTSSWDVLYFAEDNIIFAANSKSATINASARSIDGGISWQEAAIGQTITGAWDLTIFNDTIYAMGGSGIINKLHPSELKDPVIEFSNLFKGSEAQFKNESENCGSYTWEFTVDSSSNVVNPIYRFADYETHKIKLTGENAVGADFIEHDVTVLQPTNDFTYYTEDGNNVFFTNTSTNCANFEWNFGELSVSNEELTTSHVYSSFGTYTVTLTADNYIDTISVEKEVTIDSIGAFWSKNQLEIDQNLLKMHVFNDEKAIAIGIGTTIIKSTDGGDSWYEVTFPVENDGHTTNDIVFFDENNGLISASAAGSVNGFMLQTSDAGENWTQIPLTAFSDGSGDETIDPVAGSKVYFFHMEQIDANKGFVVVKWIDASSLQHGFIYKTEDKGATWAKTSGDIYQENSFTSFITDVAFAPEGMIGFVSGNKFLLKTEDGGSTWTSIPAESFGYITELLVLNNDTILAATGIGVLKTTDRFANYKFVTSTYTNDIISLGNDKYMAGKDAATLGVTDDLGENWVSMGNGLAASFFELTLFNNKIFAFSSKGMTSISYLDNYQTPVVDFEFSIDDLAVTFTNKSENILACNWNFGDTEVSTELSLVHNYADYGKYTVELDGNNRCQKASVSKEIELVKATGVDLIDASTIKIYPNPVTNNKLYIDLGNISNEDLNVEIYNTEGRQIMSERHSSSSLLELNININKGLYFVKVSNNKDINHTMKLIVQ